MLRVMQEKGLVDRHEGENDGIGLAGPGNPGRGQHDDA